MLRMCSGNSAVWFSAMQIAEVVYFALLKAGAAPQQARSVLPDSLKTELIMTCNMREWRHIFELRCAPDVHPQMREIMLQILQGMYREGYKQEDLRRDSDGRHV
jgi:thymidylate synthase (FAD)